MGEGCRDWYLVEQGLEGPKEAHEKVRKQTRQPQSGFSRHPTIPFPESFTVSMVYDKTLKSQWFRVFGKDINQIIDTFPATLKDSTLRQLLFISSKPSPWSASPPSLRSSSLSPLVFRLLIPANVCSRTVRTAAPAP
jgi:hypothetical protein